jgi:hypothetical protein
MAALDRAGAGKSVRVAAVDAAALPLSPATSAAGGTGSFFTLLTNARKWRMSSGSPASRDGELNGDPAALRQSPAPGSAEAAPPTAPARARLTSIVTAGLLKGT